LSLSSISPTAGLAKCSGRSLALDGEKRKECRELARELKKSERIRIMKKALITGIAGQDGSHLAEFLLGKGYQVHGLARRSATKNLERLRPWRGKITSHQGDLADQGSINRILDQVQPDEIYNLASLSFVPASWQEPVLSAESTAVGVTRLLTAIRLICPSARFFQASSSEMFGPPCLPVSLSPCLSKRAGQLALEEDGPFRPRSPYGVAKLYAHHMTVSYRETYGLFAASGILFNHEGPRRGLEFVTRKITHAVARIKLGLAEELPLGNLEAKRDWGYAGDYVRAMWLMLQHTEADDFVIGTGSAHSVEEFVQIAFDRVGLNWQSYVVVDPRFYRPTEDFVLTANNAKARRLLGWQPEISFPQMVTMMVDADMDLLRGKQRRAFRSVGLSPHVTSVD
jgi:GDPmannose 4,6-dehydratase